jgi:predicted HTH transcriptional regulator
VATNGGVLLVGKNREQVFPFAHVMCARFRGEQRIDIFDRIEVHEHLPLAVDKVMDFLKKHAFRTAEFGDVRRRDVWSIPVDAVREVVVNALVHASYSIKGSPIRVAFCDDRIEVDSPGGLVPGITVEDMVRGVSSVRNPTLARVFAEMGLMEKWGTGVPGVYAAVAADGLPEPEITELPKALRFTVFIKNHRPQIEATPGTTRGAGAAAGVEVPGQVTNDVPVSAEITDQVAVEVTDQVARQHAILRAAAGEAPPSRSDLMAVIGVTSHSYNVRRFLAPLLEAELLELTQPDSPRSPTQRYRTTAAGRAILEARSGAKSGGGDE